MKAAEEQEGGGENGSAGVLVVVDICRGPLYRIERIVWNGGTTKNNEECQRSLRGITSWRSALCCLIE